MVKKLLSAAFLGIFCFVFLIPPVYAQEEFKTGYAITYDVDSQGLTTVTEDITLTNLTSKYYASRFTLSIGATDIRDISASDNQGPLSVSSKSEQNKTEITVNFTQQMAGKGKSYPFKLIYRSNDFAQKSGSVWQVAIPKITSVAPSDSLAVTLKIPASFGSQASIEPTPVKTSIETDKLVYQFSKDQLAQGGILADYGTKQNYSFFLTYNLKNNSLLPSYQQIPIIPDTQNQTVSIDSINPKPDNVTIDPDGNFIAGFKLFSRQSLQVMVRGSVELNEQATPSAISQAEAALLTRSQPYWNKDNPQIIAKLRDLLKGKNSLTTQQKAKILYDFVVSYLGYDQNRVKNNDFSRLGAVTALNNPSNALCQEFSDLFVTLARGADIPARELIGYAYSANHSLRPLSFQNSLLHAWAEYYDGARGWVIVDPTWENTTGGVDYFSRFDLNHIVFAMRGVSSTDPTPNLTYNISFSSATPAQTQSADIQIQLPSNLYAGFPAELKVRIENNGTGLIAGQRLTLTTTKPLLSELTDFYTPAIPPKGYIEYTYPIRTQSYFQPLDDVLKVKFGKQSGEKKITIKPFFAHSLFSVGVILLLILMGLTYLWLVVWHMRSPKSFRIKVDNDPLTPQRKV